MTDLATAFVAELDDAALEMLAERLAPLLADRLARDSGSSTWLDAKGAAAYLATTRDRVWDLVQLHKLKPRRDGTRLLFKRTELDAYLEASA